MAEIRALPWNGLNAISTFSGCGGSCLGYRMAGFRVLWASEFIPAAQEVYRLNHPTSILDTRDIRQVKPEEILAATGLKAGDLDLMDGSPPCASFSTAGKREAGWGKVKVYSDTKQRTDDLFFEYVRILSGLQPKAFVAENVSGLVKGTAKGYFLEILAALKGAGYRVKAKVLDAQWLGVPQMRARVIFQGVRSDLGLEPAYPKPLPYQYSVRDAIPWVNTVSCLLPGKQPGKQPGNRPCPTVTTGDTGGNGRHEIEAETDISAATVVHPTEKRRFSIAELKRICAFPDDFQLVGTYSQQWERLGRAVPPVMMAAIAATVRDEVLCKL